MKYITEKEYNARLKKIQHDNLTRERKMLLKQEEGKYKQSLWKMMKTSNKLLIVSVIAIISYTVFALWMTYMTGISPSDTLSTLWYSFWTVEIVALTGIKVSKVFKNYGENTINIKETSSEDEDSEDYCG